MSGNQGGADEIAPNGRPRKTRNWLGTPLQTATCVSEGNKGMGRLNCPPSSSMLFVMSMVGIEDTSHFRFCDELIND